MEIHKKISIEKLYEKRLSYTLENNTQLILK
jgi:hypothetical protein